MRHCTVTYGDDQHTGSGLLLQRTSQQSYGFSQWNKNARILQDEMILQLQRFAINNEGSCKRCEPERIPAFNSNAFQADC
ncbi:hypothetical protein D3C86_2125610 [compost metagenome]